MMQSAFSVGQERFPSRTTPRGHPHALRSGDGEAACTALFAKTEAVDPLDADQRSVVADAVIEIVSVASGRPLLARSHGPDRIHLMVQGWAYRSVTMHDGGRQITDILLPGDFCDSGDPDAEDAGHDVRSCGPAQMAVLRKDAVLGESSAWLHLRDRARQEETAILRARLVSLGRRDACARLAHLLIELSRRLRRVALASDGVFDCPLTQEQLGDALGLTAVHVNRVLQTLRRDGVIAFDRPTMVIRDLVRLQDLAGVDGSHLI